MSKSKAKGIAVLFAFALAFVLAAFLSMSFPMAEVHAAETHEVTTGESLMQALENAGDGDTIQLTENITQDLGGSHVRLEDFAKSLTVDLNGHTLSLRTTSTLNCINFTKTDAEEPSVVTLAIVDNSAAGGGTLEGVSAGSFISSGENTELVLRDIAVKFTNTGSVPAQAPALHVRGSFVRDNVTFNVTNAEELANPSTTGGVATYVVNGEDDLAAAIADEDYAIMEIAADLEISLDADLEKNIVVAAGNTVTIDLNGFTLTNAAAEHTIVNRGSLTVVDSSAAGGGTVDNVSDQRAALLNYGTVLVEEGSFVRGESAVGNWYVIKNYGYMTLGENEQSAVTVTTSGDEASLIDNGYVSQTDKDENEQQITVAENFARTLIINGGNYSNGMNAVKNDSEGNLVINGGSFTNSYYVKGSAGAVILTSGTSTIIKDGTFTQTASAAHGLRITAAGNGQIVSVTVSGGTFSGNTDVYLMNESAGNSSIDVVIEGGTFDSDIESENHMHPITASDKIAITGGTFNADVSLGRTMQVSLTGGDYANVPDGVYLAEEVNIYQYTSAAGEKEGMFVLGVEQPENAEEVGYVRIGNTYYNTLQEALNYEKYATIYVCRDITESVTYSGTTQKNIELSGFCWTAEEGSPALTTENGAGIVYIRGGTDGLIQRTDAGAVVVNAGTMNFSTGTFTVKNEQSGEYALIENSGRLTFANGTFESGGELLKNSGTVSAKGGTFDREFDVQGSDGNYEYIDEGYYLADNGNGTYTVTQAVAWVDLNGDGKMSDDEMFKSAQAAVNAAQNGDTVVVFSYTTGGITVAAGQDITLEMRSGSLAGGIVNNGTLTITGGNGTVNGGVVNNGSLRITGGKFQGMSTGVVNHKYLIAINEYLADGYCFTEYAVGDTYSVGKSDTAVVVKDGDAELKFGSFGVAINYITRMAESEEISIAVLCDVELEDSAPISSQNTSGARIINIDLGGNTLTNPYTWSIGSSYKNLLVTIGSGEIVLGYADGHKGIGGISVSNGAELLLKDVSVVYEGSKEIAKVIGAGYNASVGSVTLDNVDIICADGAAAPTDMVYAYAGSDLEIISGIYYGGISAADGANVVVSGGTYNFLVEEDFLAEGYAPLAQGDGTYAVVDEEEAANAGDAVAAIETESGRVLYATLADAIANAEDGATIVLIANVEVTSASGGSGIAINDKSLTIDFNGYKIIDRGTGSALTVGGTSVVTLIDSGESGGVEGGSGGNNVAVTALGSAVVNIEGGVYSVGPDASGLGNNTIYINSADAQVNISGGTFSSEAMFNGKYYVLNQNNSAAGDYTVTGGTFVNFNPIIGDDYLGGTFIDPEAAVALDEDGNFTVYADPSDVPAEAEAVYAFENGAAVAVVKTEDALIDAFAGEYEVIRLGAGFTLDEQIRICRDVTLDLSDYTLSIGSDGLERADMVVLATYTEDGSAGLLTIKGNAKGTIDATNADDLTVPVGAMGAGSKVIIESGTIIVDTELESCVFVNTDAKVEITGGTFINRAAKYSRNDDNGPALTVNVRAGAPDAGELLVINGGTFVGRNPAMGDDSVSGSFLADNVVLGRASDGSFTVYESAEAAVSAGANAVYTVDESGAALAVVYDEASLSEALSYGYETVRLGADIDVTGELTVPEGRELTLDLAGKTLQKTTNGHFITNSGTLTITDSTVSSEDDQAYGGKIEHTFPTAAGNPSGYTIRNYGDLTLEKITVQNNTASTSSLIANNAAKSDNSYEQANPAVLTINSGYYLSCGANAVKNDEYGRLFINGGLFVSEDATKTVSGDHEFVSQAVQNWAYAEITGGTFEGVYVGLSANAYGGQTNTTLIKGGTFRATDAETGRGLQLTQGDSSNDTPGVINVTVSGGTFESPVEYGAVDTAVFSSEDSFTVTEGSTAVFEDDVLLPMEMNISIADGEYHGTVDAGEKEGYITGGDFAVLPDSTAFAEGFAAADPDGDGIYTTVDESDYIVSMTVNGKRVVYETLADAVAAAPTDGAEAIIEFIGAETEYRGAGIVVNAGQNIVIDFNGKTYIVIDPTVGSSGTETNGFQLLKGATVVMQGGTLKAETTEAQILIQKYCDLTLKNMTLDARGSNVKYVVSNNNGKTVFSGDTNIYAAENNCAFDVYYWPQGGNGYTGGAQVVFDSTFNGTVVGNVEYTRDTSGYEPEGGWQSVSTLTFEQGNEGTFDIEFTDIDGTVEAAGIEIAGGSFTNPVDYRLFKEGFAAEWNEEDGAYVVDEGEYIVTATVEGVEVGFTSLQDAIDAADIGGTVTLLKSVNENITIAEGQNIVLDLNGNTIESAAADVAVRITADATIENGTLLAADGAQAMYIDGAVVELRDMIVTGGAQSSSAHLFFIQLNDAQLTLDDTDVNFTFVSEGESGAQGQAIRAQNSDVTVRNNSNIAATGYLAYGIAFRGQYAMGEEAMAADAETYNTLTIEDSFIKANAFAVSGNGVCHGTNIIIAGNSRLESEISAAIYHPQYGTLNISLADDETQAYIKGTAGIEMRAGSLVVESGYIEATGDFVSGPHGGGSTTDGAAIAIVQHTTRLPISVELNGGKYVGDYAVYENNQQDNPAEAVDNISLSITGGTFEGDVESQNLTGFIAGGQFAFRPAEDYMDPDYVAELQNGYYVPVESSALRAAQANAQADVRAYLATFGMTWKNVQTLADGGNEDAAALEAAYEAIAGTTSEKGVADARLAAMDAVDELVASQAEAWEQAKAAKIAELETWRDENAAGVVIPLYIYTAMNNAADEAELESYFTWAQAELKDIFTYRNQITAQASDLSDLKQMLTDLSSALTGENNSFDELLKNVEEAISKAQSAIVGTDADSDSLAGIRDYLENTINTALEGIDDAINGADGLAAQLKGIGDTLNGFTEQLEEITDALAEDSGWIAEAIAAAQGDITAILGKLDSLATGADISEISDELASILEDIAAVQGTVDEIAVNVSTATEVSNAKEQALTDIETWLNSYLDSIIGGTDEANSGTLIALAFTAETTDGDIYAKLTQVFSEDNAQLVLRYYNEALASIDAATTVSEVTTAVSTFKAQVASVEAAAQNTTNLTGMYVLLAVVLVAVVVVLVVVLLKKNRPAAEAAQPAQAVAQPAEQAEEPAVAEEVAQEEPAEESAEEPAAEENELAAELDDDKEQVIIAANVRSFSEAYVELDEELLSLFNKVKEYALAKEGATEVKQSSGVCIKRSGKQVVKLTVRRGYPVALFLLENEMLKDFRRTTNTNAKLKIRATELVLREEADLEAAYTMVDLSVEQIDKDIENAKERRREARRARRRQKQLEEEAQRAQEIAADAAEPEAAEEIPSENAEENGDRS